MFAEMSLPDLFMLRKKDIKMKPLPVYPSSERDWTITLLEKAPARQVVDVVHSIPSKLLEKVSLINIFRGSQVGQDKKNCTFRFIYRDKDKTISLEDVEMEHKRLIAATLDLIGGCLPEN
jgi:phenylalanyl-tRNA synthetase beta chain